MIIKLYKQGDGMLIDAIEEGLWNESIADNCVAVSFYDEGRVVACAGVKFVDEDEVFLWLRVSKELPKNILHFIREMAWMLRVAVEDLGNPSVMTVIRDGFTQSERLAKLIGFKRSGEYKLLGNVKYMVYRR